MALQNPEQNKLFTTRKPSKYGNKKIVLDGVKLDSIAEAAHYVQLKKENSIFQLRPSFRFRCGIVYVADFLVNTWVNREDFLPVKIVTFKWDANDSNHLEWWLRFKDCWNVVDVKGVETPAFRIKRKLLKTEFGIDIVIVRPEPRQALALVNAYIGEKSCQHSSEQAANKLSCALPSSDQPGAEKRTRRSRWERALDQGLP